MKAYISPTARRAALMDEHDNKWVYTSVGSKDWQSAGANSLDAIFNGSRDYEIVEAEDLAGVEKQLRIKSDGARAIAMFDIALTAPDKADAAWAGAILNKLISSHEVRTEAEKFLFAAPMPTPLSAERFAVLAAIDFRLSLFLRDLEKAQPRISLMAREFEKTSRRNRLSATQKAATLSMAVQTGLFRQLARPDLDRAEIAGAIDKVRPKSLPAVLKKSVYGRVSAHLGRAAARDYEKAEKQNSVSRPIPILTPILNFFVLIQTIIRVIISLLTLRI